MEWLRSVNLAEYAPNLRGSGVHGSLLINEPLFTSDLLAALLSIHPAKTLLRRHLNLHFIELVGKNCMQFKRDVETSATYQPLTASAKVKEFENITTYVSEAIRLFPFPGMPHRQKFLMGTSLYDHNVPRPHTFRRPCCVSKLSIVIYSHCTSNLPAKIASEKKMCLRMSSLLICLFAWFVRP